MKLTQKRIAVFIGLLIVIAVLGSWLLKDFGIAANPFKGRDDGFQRLRVSIPESNSNSSVEDSRRGRSMASLSPHSRISSQTGNALALLEGWLAALSKNDTSTANALVQEMIESLHTNPDGNQAFYQRARQVLEDGSIDASIKQTLIGAMDRAATPSAINLLAAWFQPDLPVGLKDPVYRAIANTGQYFWDKKLLPMAIPALQRLWMQSDDPNMLRAVATALAKVGNPESVNSLMDSVLSNSKTIADIEHSSDPRVSAALFSLQGLRDPAVIPIFQEQLRSSSSSLEMSVYARLLAGMGQISATQALLSWAQGAGSQYASVAGDAFAKTGSSDCLQYANSVLAQNVTFKSSLVKTAVLSALAALER
jgi:hypothetical protein